MAKLSISKAWDETREVFGRDGKLLVAVAMALVLVPSAIGNFVVPIVSPGQLPTPGAWMIIAIFAFFLVLAGLLAICRLALEQQTTVRDSIWQGARRLFPFVIVMLLVFIAIVVAAGLLGGLASLAVQSQAVALMLSFVILIALSPLLARLVLVPAIAAAEAGGPFKIIRRSWQLTSGSGARLIGAFILGLLAAIILEVAVAAIFGSATYLVLGTPDPGSLSKLALGLITGALRAAEFAVLGAMLSRLYVQATGDHIRQVSVPSTGD